MKQNQKNKSMYDLFRAALLTIENYILRYRCNTIRMIITRWMKVQNPEIQIQQVCRLTGIGGNEPLSNYDPRLKILVAALVQVESGEDIQVHYQALELAFDNFQPQSIWKKERRKHKIYQ